MRVSNREHPEGHGCRLEKSRGQKVGRIISELELTHGES